MYEFYDFLRKNNPEVVKRYPKYLIEYKGNLSRFMNHSIAMNRELEEFEDVGPSHTLYRVKNLLKQCRNLLRHVFIFALFVQNNEYTILFEVISKDFFLLCIHSG